MNDGANEANIEPPIETAPMPEAIGAETSAPIAKTPPTGYRLPPITLLSLLAEVGFIVIFGLISTWSIGYGHPGQRLAGGEFEWLTNSAYISSDSLKTYGYIPLWSSGIEFGEPFLNNPFSFVLNPISTVPSWLQGAVQGLRTSVVLYAIFAGLGGWVLGRVMGFGWVARLALALLMLGKSNMVGMVSTGYFQLGVTQAYIPWVAAGMIALLRLRHRRWPIVLTAIMFTWLFWGGNIWFTLPCLIMMGLLTLTHLVRIRRAETVDAVHTGGLARLPVAVEIDWLILRRAALAAILTIALAAVTLLPIFAYRDRIGGHPDDGSAGQAIPFDYTLSRFVTGDFLSNVKYNGFELYYSYVLPLWIGILLFIVLPPIRLLWKPSAPGGWRLWIVFIFMFVLTVVWGTGNTPLFVYLYHTIPLLGQWRYVGRALGVASFALSVLIAARVDGLWNVRVELIEWLAKRLSAIRRVTPVLRIAFAISIVAISAITVVPIAAQWSQYVATVPLDRMNDICVSWLRQQFPTQPLAVFIENYPVVIPIFANHVRFYHLTADFHTNASEGTLYHVPMFLNSPPAFNFTWSDGMRAYWGSHGYQPMLNSPKLDDGNPCLWQFPTALSYAYTVSMGMLTARDQTQTPLISADTTPIPMTAFNRYPDRIGLLVAAQSDQPEVVTLQEANYPGWKVEVDDQPAALESIGGQIGVLIPPGTATHRVYFYYRPDLLTFGLILTLLACVFSVLYLLKAERLVPAGIRRQLQRPIAAARRWLLGIRRRAWSALTDAQVFEPKSDK